MNEKIKQLKEQARDFYLLQEDLDCSIRELHELVDEKFAELIVQECISACSNHKDIESFGILPIRTAMVTNACENNIKDHFGVEE